MRPYNKILRIYFGNKTNGVSYNKRKRTVIFFLLEIGLGVNIQGHLILVLIGLYIYIFFNKMLSIIETVKKTLNTTTPISKETH